MYTFKSHIETASGLILADAVKHERPKTDVFDSYQIRKDFPILNESLSNASDDGESAKLVYLDNAATTQKPSQVLNTLLDYYEHQNANVHRAIHTLGERATTAYEQSRKQVAEFINAESERQVVFTRGATEAINLVATAWGRKFIKSGDEILLTEMEHHSNLIPWQILAKERHATLRFIPFTERGTLDFHTIKKYFNDRTRLVAVTHMSNVFGTINPIKGIRKLAHKRGIPILIDGAQSVPHLPVDVQELDCDFLAFSGHKMCGPTGIGVLYAKEHLLKEMEPYQGGGEMIGSVWYDHSTWNEIPHKFEAGTPNIAGAIGLASAIDYLSRIGMQNITLYEQELTNYALRKMQKFEGLRIFGQATERGGVISFNLGRIHPHDVAQYLDSRGIAVRAGHHCAQPLHRKLGIPATNRASLYFYNTVEEIDALVESLQQAREFFSHGF